MSNTKLNKLNKAELIDLLGMTKRLLNAQIDKCNEDCKTINRLSSNLEEANRQLEQYKDTIDDLTSDKVSAMEAAKSFNKEAKVAKNWSYVFAIIAVIAIAIAIIF